MAETPDQTRREIEETRLRIAEATEELEERLQETTDWRKFIGRYPLESFAVALGVGFIVGAGLLFGLRGRLRTTGRVVATGGRALNWVRPIITPVITARLVDYMRKRSQ